MDPLLNVHQRLPASRANGPGLRAVIWFQGCTLACPGCFNPLTHPVEGRQIRPVSEWVDWLLSLTGQIEGVTLSGGEPFQQAAGLLALCRAVRSKTDLSILLFSGYTLTEIRHSPEMAQVLDQVDVLIAGRFLAHRRVARGLTGSANKRIHYLTSRYTPGDLENTPEAEVLITPTGEVINTGIQPLSW